VRLAQDDARAAETAALRAAALAPRSSYYSELLGRTQFAGHRNDAGIASLEQAITLDRAQTARLAFTIGVRRERQGKLPEAQIAYERAATADPRAVLPRLALARLHLGTGRVDEAKRRLDECRAQVPSAGAKRELFARLDARVATLIAERNARREREFAEGFAARDQAVAAAGVLGLLRALNNSDASPFGGDTLGNDAGDALGSMRGDTIGDNFGVGGLGLVGTGRGGGGVAEDTIGIGSIGTIGHGAGSTGGSGQGYGRGGIGTLGGSAARPAVVTPGSAAVMGSLSVDVIRRVVRQHLNELRYCYESALARNAALSGLVSMSFVVGPTGAVIESSATGLSDPAAVTCLASSVRRWSFPAPQGGGIVRVTYPINLQPPTATPPSVP
jgi:hypothetical protein